MFLLPVPGELPHLAYLRDGSVLEASSPPLGSSQPHGMRMREDRRGDCREETVMRSLGTCLCRRTSV